MGLPTNPLIAEAQNSDRGLRLLAAQRRLYSDAKVIHNIRLTVVCGGAVLSIVGALALPEIRMTMGLLTAATLLLISLLGSGREKRRNREAASIQEEFDVWIFRIPWNEMLAERPSPTVIAEAAARYDGPSMRDWYPSTKMVIRPLDVLICQRSNVGWGTSMHRLWAGCLGSTLATLVGVACLLGWLFGLSFTEMLAAVMAPLLAPMREIIDMMRANLENAQTKSAMEGKILATWKRALADPASVTDIDCRSIQDRILILRQANASIPDWLDRIRHDVQEATMRVSADHLVEEAAEHGAA